MIFTRCDPERDLETIKEIERREYPADEAASDAALEFRAREANEFFMVAKATTEDDAAPGDIIGYVCGTLLPSDELTAESMRPGAHVVGGSTLAIHSVCVRRHLQRRGHGSTLVREYAHNWVFNARGGGATSGVRSIRLLCKPARTAFYLRAGFVLVGQSRVVHGADAWNECVITETTARDDRS